MSAPTPALAPALVPVGAPVGVLRWVSGTGGRVGVTVDLRSVALDALADLGDPGGVEFRWGLAPAGLATRRQLTALGLRPGGAPVVAFLSWRRGERWAALYRVDDAAPKRAMTPGRARALAAAMAARRTCPGCGRDAGYVIPTSLGTCLDCHDRRGKHDQHEHDQEHEDAARAA